MGSFRYDVMKELYTALNSAGYEKVKIQSWYSTGDIQAIERPDFVGSLKKSINWDGSYIPDNAYGGYEIDAS